MAIWVPPDAPSAAAGSFLKLDALRPGEGAHRSIHPNLGPGWLCFAGRHQILEARALDEVRGVIAEVERRCQSGAHAHGFISYEASPALNAYIRVNSDSSKPLVWFALFPDPPSFWRDLDAVEDPGPISLEPEWSESHYAMAFDRVKAALAAGSTYQVNLTFRNRFGLQSGAERFFASRCGVDPPPHAAFIRGSDWTILSFSPELFLERNGRRVVSRPMKGTAALPQDRRHWPAATQALRSDLKTSAENLMIVDMVRNDLGRVAQEGSVCSEKLMSVERHGRILQVVSEISAEVHCDTLELLQATFPPASVTGAPKVATCSIIQELETSPRGVYCGAVGTIGPNRTARFGVAIRTAWLQGTSGEFGVGGGVVWDSTADSEHQECSLKTDVLRNHARQWRLIESLSAREPAVEAHLARLRRSAAHFGIPCDVEAIRAAVERFIPLPGDEKIRVALAPDGAWELSAGPSDIPRRTLKAALAKNPVHSSDASLRHKTTSRAVYDAHLDECPDADEVLLYNERREVTEFCRGNAIFQLGGRLFTPPPSSGCLPGVGVEQLLATGEASHRVISVEEALNSEAAYFVNAVAGILPVTLLADLD